MAPPCARIQTSAEAGKNEIKEAGWGGGEKGRGMRGVGMGEGNQVSGEIGPQLSGENLTVIH